MRWTDVCAAYPGQRLVVEALEAHFEVHGEACRRSLDRLEVIELCADGRAAMHRYRELRRAMPGRELCFIHTSYPALELEAA